MAASRSRRANAGALMAGLIKDFHEEETYNFMYGGFGEEVDDNEFGLDAVSDDGTDTDFDEEEEDADDEIKEGEQDEEERKRPRKKAKKTFPLKRPAVDKSFQTPTPRKKSKTFVPVTEETVLSEDDFEQEADLEDQTPSTSSGDKEDSGDVAASALETVSKTKRQKKLVAPSGRSIRDSTAAKRFETEELELQREIKRQENGPRKRTKHRIPCQSERLAKSLETEKKNKADLEKYERDEEENEKKKTRKQKTVKGPFDICSVSAVSFLPKLDEVNNANARALLENSEDLIGHAPGERFARSLLCFKDEDLFKRAFPEQKRPTLPQIRTCVITGKPARYRDPVTWQYYHDSQALHALRKMIYRHLQTDAYLSGNPKVADFISWYEAKYDANKNAQVKESSDLGKSAVTNVESVNGTTSKADPKSDLQN